MNKFQAVSVKAMATVSGPVQSGDRGITEIEKLPTPVEHDGAKSMGAKAALIVADFVTGGTPSTESKLTALTEFAAAHYDESEADGLLNPALAAFEALGRGFAETTEFNAKFALESEADFVSLVYKAAFGTDATVAQQAHFENQIRYFAAMYEAAEIPGPQAESWAKGAALGQMLGIAALEGAPANAYLDEAENFIVDAADGIVAYGKPLYIWDAI